MDSPIEDVSDTVFWIAYLRALESQRVDATFRDPFAAQLAGERGRKISQAMPTSRIAGSFPISPTTPSHRSRKI
jgi:O-methyltransferase involved in polyketide biosynthesis